MISRPGGRRPPAAPGATLAAAIAPGRLVGPLAIACAALAWLLALILVGQGILTPQDLRAQQVIWRDAHFYADFLTRPPAHLGRLLAMIVFLAAAVGPGDLLLKLIRPAWRDESERLLFALAAGLIVFTFGTMLLGWAELLRVQVLAPLLGLSLVSSAWYATRWLERSRAAARSSTSTARQRWTSLPALGGILLGLVLVFYVYTLLLPALGPEIQHDARWYHLGVPRHYALHGGFYDIVRETRIAPAGLPHYQEMLYTTLIAVFGVGTAKLLHWADAVLTVLAMVYFCRAHFGSVRLGLLAALIFISTPVVGWLAGTATNDLPGTFFGLLGIHALLRWRQEPGSDRWLAAAALIGGYSIGVKPFGAFTFLLLVAAMVAFSVFRERDPAGWRRLATQVARRGLLMGGIATACCLPWLVHSFQLTGNPIFPFLNDVFGSPYWNAYTQHYVVQEFAAFGADHSLRGFAALPLDATFHGDRYRAIVGPLFLACSPLLVLALAARSPHAGRLRLLAVFAAGWIAIWFATGVLVIRYTAPVLPEVAIIFAAALWMPGVEGLWRRLARGTAIALVLLVTALNHQFLVPLQRYSLVATVDARANFPWQYLYRGEPADRVYTVPMLSYMNGHLTRTDKVYDGCDLVISYLYSDIELYNGALYDSPTQMGQWSLASPDARQRLQQAGITHVAICTRQEADVLRLPIASHLEPVPLPPGTGHLLFRVDYSVPG